MTALLISGPEVRTLHDSPDSSTRNQRTKRVNELTLTRYLLRLLW